ncbi:phosphoadenosine phosphosulfate reductase [Escherichia coli]|uniref:Phosphoadenosine phosphosulfate reductase n=1 Tax=Escherichia coli TaxID=562 RepID=A0A3S4JQ80_ECOLX|nr:phosphoadenosine phosphosulfate reductase [Escherichia coli]
MSLHLVNQIHPDIPVILTDTGYLFPETYRFIDELTDKLKLNLKVYRATESAAWQEARYGKLWEQGVEGIEKYNDINKVEPMNRGAERTECANVVCWPAPRTIRQSRQFTGAGNSAWAYLKCCRLSTGITNDISVSAKTWPEISSIMGRRIFIRR